MKFKTALFSMLLLSTPVHADEFHLHLGSKHAGNNSHLNEDNYGIGWRDDGQVALTAGYFRNSWDNNTVYLGVSARINQYVSVSLVGATGYKDTSPVTERYLIADEILPMPTVSVMLMPTQKVSPALTLAPTQDGGVILFSLVVINRENRAQIVGIEEFKEML